MVPEPQAMAEVVDPVCGMTISPADAVGHVEHKGYTYYFCAESCLEQFSADPERFLTGPAKAGPHLHGDVPKGGVGVAEWTCPMHPEVVRSEPGPCPICGMALEPRTITLDEHNPELDDMTRRLRVSAALTVPTLLLAMSELLPSDLAHTIPGWAMNWIQLVLATPVVLWGGWPFFVRGWKSLVHHSLNMFTLIALGVAVAWVFSVIATLVPGVFPDSLRMHNGQVGVYFEAAAVIVTLVLLGQV